MTEILLMPIAPEHRWHLPLDWRELSHLIRFTRAQGRCEHCGRPHGLFDEAIEDVGSPALEEL